MPEGTVLHQQLRVLRDRGPVVVVIALAAACAAFLIVGTLPRVYESRVTLMAGQVLSPESPDLDGLLAAQRMGQTYAQLATMRPVVADVIDRLGLDVAPEELVERVTVQSPGDSLFLSIAVIDEDPEQAAVIANTYAEALLALAPTTDLTPGSNQLQVTEAAEPGATPVGPRTLMITLLVGILALMTGLAIVFLAEYLDDRLRRPADLADAAPDLPVIAVLPHEDGPVAGRHGLTSVLRPHSPTADAFRTLRARLGFARPGTELRTLLVVGEAGPVESADVAANLAVEFAEAGMPTTLIDADIRGPRVHRMFNQPNDEGLTDLLAAPTDATPRPSSHASVVPQLRILVAGPSSAPPDALMTPPRLRRVFARSLDESELVVVNAPSLPDPGEVATLASTVDGVVLLVQGERTTRAALAAVRESIERAGGRIVGLVYVEGSAPRRTVRERVRTSLGPIYGQREST